jgi:RHS repeat-associated protein
VYGLGRIAEERGSEWEVPLGDALGSVRQWTDDQGAVTYSAGYEPFGEGLWSAGSTESAWGYTGEWQDLSLEMVYLRARWYAVGTGRFTQEDIWTGNRQQPQSLHYYVYVENNPINLADPNGHCAGSDCERFVEEVDRFITLARSEKDWWFSDPPDSEPLVGYVEKPSDSDWGMHPDWIIQLLAGYYAGFRINYNISFRIKQRTFGCTLLIPPGVIVRDTTPERWLLQDNIVWQAVDDPPVAGAEEAAINYGFKRIFYDNTHHYFADLYLAYFYGSTFARQYNNRREAEQYRANPQDYYSSAADILVAEVAIKHAQQVRENGIETLSQLLREDACGDSLEEIYAEWVWPNPTVERWLGPPPKQ